MKSSAPGDFFFQGFYYYEFNFLNSYKVIRIISFILDEIWQFVLLEELVHFI